MPDLPTSPLPLSCIRTVRVAAMVAILALLFVSCGGNTETADLNAGSAGETPVAAPASDSAAPATPPTNAQTDATPAATAVPELATPQPETAAPETAAPETAAPEPTPTTEIPRFEVPDGIVPVRIEITAIGVDAPTIDLSLAGAEPEVPSDFDDAGWYTQTRLPGEIGPAVIAGHIDSVTGPAVFAELDQLVPGDEITVYDDAGDSRTFVVVEGNLYPKGDLPPGVFGFGQPEPELRLITCGGTFDKSSGHYRDNYVVFARLAA